MSEQQLADLFTEQIDRMLAGEAIETPVEELTDLLNLGQQLTQVRYQASPTAQAAFQGQMASWFGSTGGTGLGLSKGMLMAIMTAVGTGIGLIALVTSLLGGDILNDSDSSQMPERSLPAVVTPVDALQPAATRIVTPTATPLKPTMVPATTSSDSDTLPSFSELRDTLPISTTELYDVIPLPSATPTPTITSTITTEDEIWPVENSDGPDDGNSAKDDYDRGHGNDLDGVDEDNPGNSSGVGQGSNENQGSNKDDKGSGNSNKGGNKNK
jgi:hypothetical protein